MQTCVVHLLRNSFSYAGRQHRDVIAKALRPVYTASSEAAAKERFNEFAADWGIRYPAIVRLWENAWAEFVPFLDYDVEVRRVICTTNTIESRYRVEGEAVFEPRPRRLKTSPRPTPAATVVLVLRLRKELVEQGLDAGADTIGWHLEHHHRIRVSRATIHRILARAGAVTPAPGKRPRSSYLRFQADRPNEWWQADFTHYRLTDPGGGAGSVVEILSWLDDHSRCALSDRARQGDRFDRAPQFRETVAVYGVPASTLTDIQAWCRLEGPQIVRPAV